MIKAAYRVTYERNEYAKRIRKQYEAHQLSERMCNLRQRTICLDGFCGTLTGVLKDNYVLVVTTDD